MHRIHFFTVCSLIILLTPVQSFTQVLALGTGQVKESNSNTNTLVMDNYVVPVGSDVILVVATRNANVAATAITYNGNALTKLNGTTNGAGNSSIWYLLLGDVTTAITANIQMTLPSASQTKMMAAMSFKNVLQSNPMTGFLSNNFTSSASSSTLNITGEVGDMAFDVISSIGSSSTPPTFTIGAGQSIVGTGISSSEPKRRISSSYEPFGSTSTNMSWTISGSSGGLGIHLSARIHTSLPLPVELVTFTATNQPNSVFVNWETESETNNEGFWIQRSLDGKLWEDLGWLPGAGTTLEKQVYRYVDSNPSPGVNYYRLVQKDFDDRTSISFILSVNRAIKDTKISISPNPWSSGPCEITALNLLENKGTLLVIDQLGRIVSLNEVVFTNLEKSIIPFETKNLSAGNYFVRLESKGRNYQCQLTVL